MSVSNLPIESIPPYYNNMFSGNYSCLLNELLRDLVDIRDDLNIPIFKITLDSSEVEPGSLFIAIPGCQQDGREFIQDAIDKGASAVIYESVNSPEELPVGPPCIEISSLASKVCEIAGRFFHQPGAHLNLIGVTGTNGKSSIVHLLGQALSCLSKHKTGVIGTLGHGIVGEALQSQALTTPDAISLQQILARLQQQEAERVLLEVSSHALVQHRVAALKFDMVIWTNIGQDHADYHKTVDEYAEAKASLFSEYSATYGLLNIDDPYAALFIKTSKCKKLFTYGKQESDLRLLSVRHTVAGLELLLRHQGQDFTLQSALHTEIHIHNLLAVVLALLVLGNDMVAIGDILFRLEAPPGRMQAIPLGINRPRVYVDYAHTPEALALALQSSKRGDGKLICVFGCGGDRDETKRSEMGKIAEAIADTVILTSDNPRHEDPQSIVDDICRGMKHKPFIELDRKKAIAQSIIRARPNDTILVAGKGHEENQQVGNRRIEMKDEDLVRQSATLPMMSLSVATENMGGILSGEDAMFSGVSTDSRNTLPGDLFVALKGSRFDAHDHLMQAKNHGAAGCVVEKDVATDMPTIKVQSTLAALGNLAKYWRSRFHYPVFAITGSNGKTTVKSMLGAILSVNGNPLVSHGNYNNAIGLPLSILQMREYHSHAVFELGMNMPGEIANLSDIVAADFALINNAARAHLAGLGSLDGVAAAKSELFSGMKTDATMLINADDHYAGFWAQRAGHTAIKTFALHNPAQYQAKMVQCTNDQEFTFHNRVSNVNICFQLPGRHNISNALAAASLADLAGIPLADIAQGLSAYKPMPGRLRSLPGLGGAKIIDDAYNANPDSVIAALEVLAKYSGIRIMVFGDMAELGDDAEFHHREVGRYARAIGIDYLFSLGKMSSVAIAEFQDNGRHFSTISVLVEALKPFLKPNHTILVKGSNSMGMNKVVEQLVTGDYVCS